MARNISITIESNGNAAFADNPDLEVADILRKLADRLEQDDLRMGTTRVNDVNGNKCGEITIEED